MSPQFVVFSLPRSRSLWLSTFLAHGNRSVGHDLGAQSGSVADFVERFNQMDGTCETGAAFAWRLLRRYWPEIRFVVVNRDPTEVAASLERLGLSGYLPEMETRLHQMAEISAQPGTLTVEYGDLAKFEPCNAIFEHCNGSDAPWSWWNELDRTNIQLDLPAWLESLRQNQPNIEAMKSEIAAQLHA